MIVSIWINLSCFSTGKKSISSFTFSLILQTCYFGYFRHAWLPTPNVILSTCRKLLCLSPDQKLPSSPKFFWKYCKDMKTSYFGYFGDSLLWKPKMIVWTCRKLWCLSACQKLTLLFTSFLRYYILKNTAIWLVDSILAHSLRTRILSDMELVVKYQ